MTSSTESSESKNVSLRPNDPGDFSSAWGNSDAVLRAEDSKELLHVNRMTLATFSPYFRTLFFSDFIEKDQYEFEMDVGYECLLVILEVIHHRSRNFKTTGHTLCRPSFLKELYIAADKKDIPVVRELVRQQLPETKPADAFAVAFDLDLENEKRRSLGQMSSSDVAAFLGQCDENRLTSVKDVKEMLKQCGWSFPNSTIPQNCQVEKSIIPENFDKAWGTSNVTLRAADCENKPLHVNSSVLATFSPFFCVLFEDPANDLQNTVDLDVEYEILLEILRVLHHVNRNFGLKNHKIYTPEKIAKLYAAAEKWDMKVIKELCRQQLLEVTPLDAIQLAIDLNLLEERKEIFRKMTLDEMESFLAKNKDKDLMVLSLKEMAEFTWKMKEAMNGRIRCPVCNHNIYLG